MLVHWECEPQLIVSEKFEAGCCHSGGQSRITTMMNGLKQC